MAGAIDFSIDEVLKMAERIESNGSKFYRKAAENSKEGSELLLKLADQEDAHFATFEGMRKALTPREKEPTAGDPYDEGGGYLRALVDHYALVINEDPAEALTGREALDEILNIASGLEKDSIVFYAGLRELVPKNQGKDKIDAVIKEELRHLAWIDTKRAELRAD